MVYFARVFLSVRLRASEWVFMCAWVFFSYLSLCLFASRNEYVECVKEKLWSERNSEPAFAYECTSRDVHSHTYACVWVRKYLCIQERSLFDCIRDNMHLQVRARTPIYSFCHNGFDGLRCTVSLWVFILEHTHTQRRRHCKSCVQM